MFSSRLAKPTIIAKALLTITACILLARVSTSLVRPETTVNAQGSEPLVWTDPATGMTWAKKDNGSTVQQADAIAYCRDLRLAGFRDWRLPTIDQLRQIYNSSANEGAYHIKGRIKLSGDPAAPES